MPEGTHAGDADVASVTCSAAPMGVPVQSAEALYMVLVSEALDPNGATDGGGGDGGGGDGGGEGGGGVGDGGGGEGGSGSDPGSGPDLTSEYGSGPSPPCGWWRRCG